MTKEDAIKQITELIERRNPGVTFVDMNLYVMMFVVDILSYCNRSDFPEQLIYVTVEVLQSYIEARRREMDLLEDGAPGKLKSIKQNETEFTFAVRDVSTEYGSLFDKFFVTIANQLNKYRRAYYK